MPKDQMTLDQRIAAQGGTVGTQPYTFGTDNVSKTGARRFPRSMSRSVAGSVYRASVDGVCVSEPVAVDLGGKYV